MFDQIKEKIAATLSRSNGADNSQISKRQKSVVKGVAFFILLLGFGLFILVEEKAKNAANKDQILEPLSHLKVELPDKGLDTERHWRDHFESEMTRNKEEINASLDSMKREQDDLLRKARENIRIELSATKEKLDMAKAELANAALELRRDQAPREESIQQLHMESNLTVQEFNQEVSYDRPKSAVNYIPEGTYFTGNLLGGIVVSTALNAPDENATPITIKLKGRFNKGRSTTNLSKLNKLPLHECRIMGSAYGDLSSERAIIRLEKLTCLENGFYRTSKIAGQIFGPDGFNGIKGKVVSTSTKHLKNAAIGGMISGLSSSAKGQDGLSIIGGGAITTKKKSMGDLFSNGAMSGVSNMGDKLAEYYLRQAEAMSPVLTIETGARVNAQITKGFFVGEASTHRKIKSEKK